MYIMFAVCAALGESCASRTLLQGKVKRRDAAGRGEAEEGGGGKPDPLRCILYIQQSLAVHRFKKHKVLHPVRFWFKTTHCTVCMVEFHSRDKEIEHIIDKSHIRSTHFLIQGPVLTAE